MIKCYCGDIRYIPARAVVNPANSSLVRSGGVCDVLYEAAGPQLAEYIRLHHPEGCEPGKAIATPGFNAIQDYIIHTVPPIYGSSMGRERELLFSAYTSALDVAASLNCETIAIPALATGNYGYPFVLGSRVALDAVRQYELRAKRPEIILVFKTSRLLNAFVELSEMV